MNVRAGFFYVKKVPARSLNATPYEKAGAGTEREIRPGRGDSLSGILSGIYDVPTDPIRHNIPRWSDYPFSDQMESEATIELVRSRRIVAMWRSRICTVSYYST
jgi:hypothetical protein